MAAAGAAPEVVDAVDAAPAAADAVGAAANETGTTIAAPAQGEAAAGAAAGAAANETGTTTAAPAAGGRGGGGRGGGRGGQRDWDNDRGPGGGGRGPGGGGGRGGGRGGQRDWDNDRGPGRGGGRGGLGQRPRPGQAAADAGETGTTTAAAGAAANETGTTTAARAAAGAAAAARGGGRGGQRDWDDDRGPGRGRGGGGRGHQNRGDYRGSRGRDGGPNRGAGQRGTTPVRRREQDRGETRGLGGDRVEGRHAVKELLLAGTRPVRQVVLAAEQEPAPILDDIIDLADEAGVDIRELPRGRFDQMAATDAPQGVVAFAAPLREFAVEELVADSPAGQGSGDADRLFLSSGAEHAERRTPPATDQDAAAAEEPAEEPFDQPPEGQHTAPGEHDQEPIDGEDDQEPLEAATPGAAPPTLLLVVDGVNDPGNLGAILRTAECAGVTGVVLPRHRAARITPTVAKRAAGAIEHLRFAPVSGIPTALATLADLGVWSVGLDVTADQTIWELPIADAPLALVLGAEGRGLSRLVRRRCDVTARIPVTGRLDALNVSAATAVALFEVMRRRAAT